MPWTYDRASRAYREMASGRYIGQKGMVELRDVFVDRLKEKSAGLAEQLTSGAMPVAEWEARMRGLTKAAHIDLAVLGRGGRSAMTFRDWGRVGRDIRDQYAYLGRFADQASAMSEAQVAARSALYVESAATSFERAQAVAYDVALPAYPGQDSECLVQCRCSWELEEVEGGVLATWVSAEDEATCPTCSERAAQWAPLFIPTNSITEPGEASGEPAAIEAAV